MTAPPFLIICSLLVRAFGQSDGSPTDSVIDSLTALLAEPEVCRFVDGVLGETRPVALTSLRSLLGVHNEMDPEMARKNNDYPLCDKCVKIHTTPTTNFFVNQVRKACGHGMVSNLVKTFCEYLEMGIAPLNQFFNGYLLGRSRSPQLAIATCIGDGKCPSGKAFNSFVDPIIPARLVDFTQISFCPYRPNATFSACSRTVLPLLEQFAAAQVDYICHSKYAKGELEEFCGYYVLDKDFGRGLLTSYVDIFKYVIGYCVSGKCK
ncbi:hypothetical protein FOL47_010928 [Perkinsus chesapeaki]|uniref:Uncharacterized protein n=1 Tax=Perkinsus chesapeaki TaxID=330153 RepID=A0A7J6N281_PERCH|nr:hypothetical protein FOL47_010928 [Perkinsus chesapeaki]